jgi:hypothetical protein
MSARRYQAHAAKVAALEAFEVEGYLAVLNQALDVASGIKLSVTRLGTRQLHRPHIAS